MTSSTHEADLKGNIFRRPIHTESLIVMAFGLEGDKTDQKKPSLKMSTFTAHTYSVLALFFFQELGFPRNFTSGTGIWPKVRLGNGIYTPPPPPFRTL